MFYSKTYQYYPFFSSIKVYQKMDLTPDDLFTIISLYIELCRLYTKYPKEYCGIYELYNNMIFSTFSVGLQTYLKETYKVFMKNDIYPIEPKMSPRLTYTIDSIFFSDCTNVS